MGRFRPQHNELVLIAVVRKVLETADFDAPHTVSQRRYNVARAAAGHSDTPRADKLASRFGVSWPVLRDLVLHSDDPAKLMSITGKTAARRVLTPAAAAAAVARVAQMNGTRELSSAEYERGRVQLNEATARRHTHGAHLVPLPSAQVIHHAHGFEQIAAQAGVGFVTSNSPPILPRADAIVAFIEQFGFRPRLADLEWMARQSGIQLMMRIKDPHSAAVESARAEFASKRRWFPPVADARARPEGWKLYEDWSGRLMSLAREYPRKRTRGEGYTMDDLQTAIARAFDHDTSGKRLSADRYRALTKGLGLPSYNALHRISKANGTDFASMVREEAERRATARRAPQS